MIYIYICILDYNLKTSSVVEKMSDVVDVNAPVVGEDGRLFVFENGVMWEMNHIVDNLFSIMLDNKNEWLYDSDTQQWSLMSDDSEDDITAWNIASSAPPRPQSGSLDRKEPTVKFHAAGPITPCEWVIYAAFVSLAPVRCWLRAQWLILSALQTRRSTPHMHFHKPGFLHVLWKNMLFAFDSTATIFMWHQNKWCPVDANCITLISEVPCIVLPNDTIVVVGPSAHPTTFSRWEVIKVVFDSDDSLDTQTDPSYEWIYKRIKEEEAERVAAKKTDEKKERLEKEEEEAIRNELLRRASSELKIMEAFAAQVEKEKAAAQAAQVEKEEKAAHDAENKQYIAVGSALIKYEPPLMRMLDTPLVFEFPDDTIASGTWRNIQHHGLWSFHAIGVNKAWLPILSIPALGNEYYIFLLATGIVCTNNIYVGPWRLMSQEDFDAVGKTAEFVRDFYSDLSGEYTTVTRLIC